MATEDLVWLLEGLGIPTGVDLAALVGTSRWLADVLGRPSPSRWLLHWPVDAALGSAGKGFERERGWQVADIDDFDIDRSIDQAWAEFPSRLSEIISMIDDSGDLTIGTESESDDSAPYLRFSSPAA